MLGTKRGPVATGLGQVAGLDAGKAGLLLSMLAPLVMGALGKAQRERGLDPGGLAGMLGGEQQRAADAAPGVMGKLGKFLDRDGRTWRTASASSGPSQRRVNPNCSAASAAPRWQSWK